MPRKTGIIWTKSKQELQEIVNECNSYREVLSKLTVKASSNYITLKSRLESDNIDTSHFQRSQEFRSMIPLEEILIDGKNYAGQLLRKRLVNVGLLQDVCSECLTGNVWNNKSLVLQLDHINGKHDDNRLENLRLLCPNCHSQTTTFGARRLKKEPRLCACGNTIHKTNKSGRCASCAGRRIVRPRKVQDRPDQKTLKDLIAKNGYEGTGRIYGVSGNAVKKWLF